MFSFGSTTIDVEGKQNMHVAPEGFDYKNTHTCQGKSEPGKPKKDCEIRQFEKTETRAASWGDLRKIEICYPIGDLNLITERDEYNNPSDWTTSKVLGYFPLVGFVVGGAFIAKSTMAIYNRVVKDANSFQTVENEEVSDTVTLSKKTITKLELSSLQKGAIVMLSIASYIRGLVTFLQLGILFAPIDLVTYLISKGYQKS